ncbi:MAG: hypothetical protein R8M46_03100 [Ghiorsea sp.]
MTSKLIWVPNGLLRTFSGNLSSTDLLSSNAELCADKRYADLQYIINDFTNVTGWKTTTYQEEQTTMIEPAKDMVHTPQVALVNPDGSVLDMVMNCGNFLKKESAERFVFPSIKDAYQSCRHTA